MSLTFCINKGEKMNLCETLKQVEPMPQHAPTEEFVLYYLKGNSEFRYTFMYAPDKDCATFHAANMAKDRGWIAYCVIDPAND